MYSGIGSFPLPLLSLSFSTRLVLSTYCSSLLADRMHKEITALAPASMKVKIVAPPERK